MITAKGNYARLQNDISSTPPFQATDSLIQLLTLKGDRAAQQAFCDQALNHVPNPRCVFEVLSDSVLVTAIYCNKMSSLDPLEKSRGTMVEVDIAFWSLLKCRFLDKSQEDKQVWFPSFMFVDSAAAMTAGREVFGYPKMTADILRASAANDDPRVAISALHFPEFKPTARPRLERLVSISSTSGLAKEVAISGDPVTAINDGLKSAFDDQLAIESRAGALSIPFGDMPQLMMRQFRDPTHATRASLREILLVTPTKGQVAFPGILRGKLQVELTKSASHNIQGLMGLKPSNPVTFGIWTKFDFTVGFAERLWPVN